MKRFSLVFVSSHAIRQFVCGMYVESLWRVESRCHVGLLFPMESLASRQFFSIGMHSLGPSIFLRSPQRVSEFNLLKVLSNGMISSPSQSNAMTASGDQLELE